MQELRQKLPIEDQQVLILRVGNQLSWPEIAIVMSETAEGPEEPDLSREAARLRKRFQLAKERLRVMAREAGLTS